jgi:hypothetical protein
MVPIDGLYIESRVCGIGVNGGRQMRGNCAEGGIVGHDSVRGTWVRSGVRRVRGRECGVRGGGTGLPGF